MCNISNIFFSPSYYESFGLVVLEAANTETPLLLRNLDTYKEIYYDNYLKGNNNKEFTNIIRNLKDDQKLYNEYKSKSRNIKKIYNEEVIYTKWLKLYKNINKNNK